MLILCLVIYFLFYCDSFCIDILYNLGLKFLIKYKNLSNLFYMLFLLLEYMIFWIYFLCNF